MYSVKIKFLVTILITFLFGFTREHKSSRNLGQFVKILNANYINLTNFTVNLMNLGMNVPINPLILTINTTLQNPFIEKKETNLVLPSNAMGFNGANYGLIMVVKDGNFTPTTQYDLFNDNSLFNPNKTFGCRVIPPQLTFDKSVIETIPIDIYLKYFTIGFGIDDKNPGIRVYKFLQDSFLDLDLDKMANVNFTKNTIFKKAFLSNVFLKTNKFLFLQDIDFNIYIFNLTLSTQGEVTTFFLKINGSYVNMTGISDAAIYNNYIIMSFDNKITFLAYNQKFKTLQIMFSMNSFVSTIYNKTMYNPIRSLLRIANALYVSYDKFGLKIMNLSNLDFNSTPVFSKFEFEHPKINKIDALSNPYNNLTFIGLSLLNNTANSEFFIELIALDYFYPQFSKTFVSGEVLYYDDYVTDSFYTYIFDRNSLKMIIIRRARVSTLSESFNMVLDFSNDVNDVLKVPNANLYLYNSVWLIYDYSSTSLFLGISNTHNNNLFLIKNLTYYDESLNCDFHKQGNYTFTFTGQAEFCNSSLVKNQMSYCLLNINLLLSVIKLDDDSFITFYIVLGILLSVLFFFFIFFFCYRYRCSRICFKSNSNQNGQKYSNEIKNPKGEIQDEVIEVQIEQK